MSVLRGMASVLAGVGTGLVANKEDAEKKARQDKEDAWRDEQREYQRAEIARANADRQGMRDAGAERTTMTGTVTQAGGNKYLNADPVQATKMQEMLAAEAEMTGGPAPTQQAGTGITGAMARGHQITTEPVDLKAVNGPEAVSGRFQAALRAQGKPMEALQMQQATDQMTEAARQRVKTLEKEGVGEAMAALRAGDPAGAMKAFQSSGSQKLPDGAKFVKTDGTDIFTGKPGKVWSIVGPDGATLLPDVGAAAAKFLGIDGLIARDDKMRAEEAAAAEALLEERRVAALEARAENERKKTDFLVAGGSLSGRGGSGSSSNPKPLTAMDRALIVDRRTEARKSVDALREKLIDPRLIRRANTPGPEQADYKAQLAEFQRQLADAEAEFQHWDGQMNTLATNVAGRVSQGAAQPAQKPAASAKVASLPQGAKQIGTSGGKPVYQTPDGKKFIAQ